MFYYRDKKEQLPFQLVMRGFSVASTDTRLKCDREVYNLLSCPMGFLYHFLLYYNNVISGLRIGPSQISVKQLRKLKIANVELDAKVFTAIRRIRMYLVSNVEECAMVACVFVCSCIRVSGFL